MSTLRHQAEDILLDDRNNRIDYLFYDPTQGNFSLQVGRDGLDVEQMENLVPGEAGIHIYVVPQLMSEHGLIPGDSPNLRLLDEFMVPSFLREGDKLEPYSHGFNRTEINPILVPGRVDMSHSSTFRFTSKHVMQRPEDPDDPHLRRFTVFSWEFATFHILWLRKTHENNAKATDVLHVLCFDLSETSKQHLFNAFTASRPLISRIDPFCAHGIILKVVIEQYGRVLSSLRLVIRDQEKRGVISLDLNDDDGRPNLETPSIEEMVLRNELTRHAINIARCMDAAYKTIQSMISGIKAASLQLPMNETRNTSESLKFYLDLAANVSAAAKELGERVENNDQLILNLLTAMNTQHLGDLLRESRDDGKALARLVSLLTLIFLPGTFISGFFGMNFFTVAFGEHNEPVWTHTGNWWWFLAITGPVTIVAIVLWAVPKYYYLPKALFSKGSSPGRAFEKEA